jgi:hypothetical protein
MGHRFESCPDHKWLRGGMAPKKIDPTRHVGMSEAHTSGNLTGSSPALAFCMKMKKYYLSLHGNAIFVKTKIREHAPSYPETQRREQGKAIGRHQRTAKDNLAGRRHICNHMLYPISHAAMEIEMHHGDISKMSSDIYITIDLGDEEYAQYEDREILVNSYRYLRPSKYAAREKIRFNSYHIDAMEMISGVGPKTTFIGRKGSWREVDEEEYNKISRRIRRDDFLDKLLDDE